MVLQFKKEVEEQYLENIFVNLMHAAFKLASNIVGCVEMAAFEMAGLTIKAFSVFSITLKFLD